MKNKLELLEIAIASISVIGATIYVLNDLKLVAVKCPIEPMYLSMMCLMGITFIKELKGEKSYDKL
ncbi:hypothetical protein [Streptococcus plurextorum]|uniref:hypothetical protein n=1 Tax=Streptococcus plurextorum TaxID=456876 RepID=UPI0004077476|nr:hypothetical protein [Streptococcus plurextorum]